ncbi:MAG: zinc-dependent alcohol dehydrogenase [Planctomycetota bacterium]
MLVSPGRVEIEERPDPVPGPHEAVVRVRYAGVCGTDLALASGEYETTLPLVLGHEFAGVVEATGAGVPESLVGAPVTSEINVTCKTRRDPEPCAACRRGMPAHCLRRETIGIRVRDGAFAELVVVLADALHRLPEDLSPRASVLVEPLAAAIRTFELTPISREDTVVVLGAGRLGLLICRVAHSFGARVIAVSRSESSRVLALRFGADESLAPEEAARVRETTDGLGADVVVECTGDPVGLARAAEIVRARGTVAVKTTCGRPAEGLATTDLAVREITVQGSRCGPFAKAIERLRAGQIPVDDYVSGVYPLDGVADALDAARRATKVLLEIGA